MMELTYTEEMKKQDALWEDEKEDMHLMTKLQGDIKNEAIAKGFKGYILIYDAPDEIVAEVYTSKEEYEQACSGEVDFGGDNISGNCRGLINNIKELSN